MAKLKIPTLLRPYVDGQSELFIEGTTVADAFASFLEEYSSLRAHICKEDGSLRAFVHVYVNGRDIKNLDGMQTTIDSADIINLVPTIAGG